VDRLARLRPLGRIDAALMAYTALTGRLYQAVRDVSGASVIVDSSKHASYSLVLRRLPDFDVRLIHLVRRSHGVVHSWSKRIRKPGVGDGTSFMSVMSPGRAVAYWMADNLLYQALASRMPLATRIRYEDLIAHPRGQLRSILRDLELPADDQAFSFLGPTTVELPVTHAFSGNPGFQPGSVVLRRADDEWRTALSPIRRAIISAATWPLLRQYGYASKLESEPSS